MDKVLFSISAIMFIVTYGVYSIIKIRKRPPNIMVGDMGGEDFDGMGVGLPLTIVGWLSGYIIPVVLLTFIIDIHWAFLFIINIVLVQFLCLPLTRAFMVRFSSGNSLVKDMLLAFFGGVIMLIIGLII